MAYRGTYQSKTGCQGRCDDHARLIERNVKVQQISEVDATQAVQQHDADLSMSTKSITGNPRLISTKALPADELHILLLILAYAVVMATCIQDKY
jgi:hypothetical protein